MSSERKAVERAAALYIAKGYRVILTHDTSELPAFLKEYRPDFIASSDEENVVVEVKVGTHSAIGERYRRIAELVNAHPGWRFDLVYVPASDTEQPAAPSALPPVAEIQKRLASAAALAASGERSSALLVMWSALEAALRQIAARANLPITALPASTLLRELVSAGELSRQQFETALAILPLRNQAAHGFFPEVPPTTLSLLSNLLEDLVSELDKDENCDDVVY